MGFLGKTLVGYLIFAFVALMASGIVDTDTPAGETAAVTAGSVAVALFIGWHVRGAILWAVGLAFGVAEWAFGGELAIWVIAGAVIGAIGGACGAAAILQIGQGEYWTSIGLLDTGGVIGWMRRSAASGTFMAFISVFTGLFLVGWFAGKAIWKTDRGGVTGATTWSLMWVIGAAIGGGAGEQHAGAMWGALGGACFGVLVGWGYGMAYKYVRHSTRSKKVG